MREIQNKRQPNRYDEKQNDFVIGIGITVTTLSNETLEPQAEGRHADFAGGASQNLVIRSKTNDRMRDMLNNAFIAVEKRKPDKLTLFFTESVCVQKHPLIDKVIRLFVWK